MSKRISVFYTVTVLSLFLSGAAVLLISAQDMETVSIDSTVPDIEAYSIEGLPVSFHPPEGKILLVQFMKSSDGQADECIRGPDRPLWAFSRKWFASIVRVYGYG